MIQQVNKPVLVISHNKTLAAQLYAEFKSFFPKNAVEYFVNYFDYYQPEAVAPGWGGFATRARPPGVAGTADYSRGWASKPKPRENMQKHY